MLNLETIDVSKQDGATAKRVVDAARTLGFIYVSNHSISRSLIRRVFDLSKDLFQLESKQKEAFSITPKNQGWSRMGSEKLDPATQKQPDLKEAFNIAPSSSQSLPDVLETQRGMLREFEESCQDLCRRLCKLLAIGLDLPEDYFASKHNKDKISGTIMRLLYYPAAKTTSNKEEGEIRAGAHSDYGSLTLLFQNPGQSGLEVLEPGSGRFEAVPPPSPESDDAELPILVNIADQLTLWTAGELKSTIHRVTSSYTGDRYSIAYFCHPDDDTELKPIKDTQIPSTESPLTAGEHLRRRLEATYSY